MDKIGSLKERISNSLENLSPKHKHIARFILDNWYFTTFSSANQVGEKIGTSAATVVRFSQALGYEGYTDLQDALRAEVPNYMTTASRMQKRMASKHPPDSTPSQVFDTDINNIEITVNTLSVERVNTALDKIQKAQRIYIIGAGVSYAPASFLTHSLKVMGFDSVGVHGDCLQTAVEFARMTPDDLVIAIDLWRYVRSTVNAVSYAKKAGTPVIAITDSIVSPISNLADIAFEVATEGVAHNLSVTALISLMNVVVVMLADRVPEQVYESLKKVDNAYKENELLIT